MSRLPYASPKKRVPQIAMLATKTDETEVQVNIWWNIHKAPIYRYNGNYLITETDHIDATLISEEDWGLSNPLPGQNPQGETSTSNVVVDNVTIGRYIYVRARVGRATGGWGDYGYMSGRATPNKAGACHVHGGEIYILPYAPESPSPGDIWYNTGMLYSFINISDMPATPRSTVPAGVYTEEISVDLTSTTPGAKIYYTTDGTEPTVNSQEFTESIPITDNTVVKYVAYLDGKPGRISQSNYKIRQTPVTYVDGEYGISPKDEVVVASATREPCVVHLPAAAEYKGREIVVKSASESTDVVYIYPAGTDLLDGETFRMLKQSGSAMTLKSDGIRNWALINIAIASETE